MLSHLTVMADLARVLWIRAHQNLGYPLIDSLIGVENIQEFVPKGEVATWLQIIKLIINPRVGSCAYQLLKFGLNVALVVSSTRGYVVATMCLFVACYVVE